MHARLIVFVFAIVASACAREPRPASGTPRPDPHHVSAGGASSEHLGAVFVDPGAPDPQPVREGVAVLEPTRGNAVRGTVRLRESNGRLEVFAAVEGLAPGAHAYHVHLHGDCSAADATSAGPHFHFHGSSHDKHAKLITGNLGELHATADRSTTHRTTIDASLHGRFSIVGRSIVVHEKPNDPAITPDGGAGARLACGVIGIAEVEPSDASTTTAATR
jgi:Cu-Zn family superoxide dismutase